VLKKFFSPEKSVFTGGAAGDLRVAAVKDVSEDRPFCATRRRQRSVRIPFRRQVLRSGQHLRSHGRTALSGSGRRRRRYLPWHGAQYSVETGAVLKGPATKGVASYELEVRGEDLYLKKASGAAPSQQK